MAKVDDLTSNIAVLVANNKLAVVKFLRGQGINISVKSSERDVALVLFQGLADNKFAKNFNDWVTNSQSNYGGDYSNAKGYDRFEKAFTGSLESIAVKKGDFANFDTSKPFDIGDFGTGYKSALDADGNKVDNLLTRGAKSVNWGSLINGGISFWQTSEKAKAERKQGELLLKVEQAKIDAMIKSGELTTRQGEIQLEIAREQSNAPESKTVIYIVGGAVAVTVLAVIGYVLVKRK